MRRTTKKTETAISAALTDDHKSKEPPPQTKPLTITVPQACRLSGLGATSIWQLIRDGRLDIVRVAGIKRTLIVYDSLKRLLTPAGSPAQCHAQTSSKQRARLAALTTTWEEPR